jgi:hypothetical protein
MTPEALIKSLPFWMRPRPHETLYYYEGERLCKFSPGQPQVPVRKSRRSSKRVRDKGRSKPPANWDPKKQLLNIGVNTP